MINGLSVSIQCNKIAASMILTVPVSPATTAPLTKILTVQHTSHNFKITNRLGCDVLVFVSHAGGKYQDAIDVPQMIAYVPNGDKESFVRPHPPMLNIPFGTQISVQPAGTPTADGFVVVSVY